MRVMRAAARTRKAPRRGPKTWSRIRSAAWTSIRTRAKHRAEHAGRTYYFCSAGCRDEVRGRSGEVPRAEDDASAEPVPEGTIYTCPMHPEIRQVGPGSCPICGMALEPVTGDRRDRAQPRARRHDAAVLDRRSRSPLPVLVLEMGGHLTGLHMLLGQTTVELAAARARDAGRAVGRLAVLRARLAVAR